MLQLVESVGKRETGEANAFDAAYDRLLDSVSYDRLDTVLRRLMREAYEEGFRAGRQEGGRDTAARGRGRASV